MRLMWEALMPNRPTSTLLKEGECSKYSNRVISDPKLLEQVYHNRNIRIVKDHEDSDPWEVNSDDEARFERITRPSTVDDKTPNILESEWSVESYYPQGSIWPCVANTTTSTRVALSVEAGMKVDFEVKTTTMTISSGADKPTESIRRFTEHKLD